MGVNKEDAYQCALCMDLTADCFQFAILNPKTKKIISRKRFELSTYSKDELADLLKDELFGYEYLNYSLTTGTIRNTLIPVDLFSFSKPKEIFKLNYPEPFENLDYNRIPELGIVNIYEVPLWIKSLFVIKFPRIKIVHRSTALLKGVFDLPTFSPKLHLLIDEKGFYLLLTQKSKLVYFNHFDYKELSDIIYFVHFVLEQKELDQSDFDIHLYGQKENWKGLKVLQDHFASKIKIANEAETAEDFLLAKQLLCV
ncbi:DUF3822 family protein [Crocinitomix algicola]|uniref:DUF3822 family protein n=1 Tax=Crocinitomix algicola TaxID=1740263 RepID=UPI000872EED5|nr:DUF3822 family protein [Crocinitomix algicola]